MITYSGIFYKQKMPFSAGKQMNKICHFPYKKGHPQHFDGCGCPFLWIFSESV